MRALLRSLNISYEVLKTPLAFIRANSIPATRGESHFSHHLGLN